MWKVDSDRAYPFRHKHANHFQPSPSSSDINNCNEEEEDHWSYQNRYQLSPSLIDEDEEVPIVFRRPLDFEVEGERRPVVRNPDIVSPSGLPVAQQPNSPLIPPPPAMLPAPNPHSPPPQAPTPPPMHASTERHRPRPLPPITPTRSNSRSLLLPPNLSYHQEYREPPTPSSQAPKNVTGLLTDVLSIMNSIMSQQALVASENELLEDLTELVVILQAEAEEMLQLADFVEEYCDEIEVEVQGELEREGLKEWADDLGLRFGGDGGLGTAGLDSVIEQYRRMGDDERGCEANYGYDGYDDAGYGHEREDSLDSGIGMGTRDDVLEERGQDGHVGELRLSVYKPKDSEYKSKESEKKPRKEHRRTDSDSKSRKMKPKNAPPQFRDSGLALLSPENSPRRNKSSRKPRWI
ncbi:hypothetical protein BDZ45DRAFT_698323 [Acephala macrosclerotiorum]|nr:hypothetical protein BDZ45DRAFT_698323 [Acephala macrosclerotiorum]